MTQMLLPIGEGHFFFGAKSKSSALPFWHAKLFCYAIEPSKPFLDHKV